MKRLFKKADQEEMNYIEGIVQKWYKDGQATWEYRGAPGRDGKFGGDIHFLGDIEIDEDGSNYDVVSAYKIGIDWGSADKKRAMQDLKGRLPEYNVLGDLNYLYITKD